MRRNRRTPVESDRAATETPDSDDVVWRLDCHIENGEDTPRATLFPTDADADELVTHWLTADADDLVSLADCR